MSVQGEPGSDGQAPCFTPLHPPSMDEDPDTSLVTSLALHLMSEHDMPAAITMSKDKAERLHHQLHMTVQDGHPLKDHRFRPGRALLSLVSIRRPVPVRQSQRAGRT